MEACQLARSRSRLYNVQAPLAITLHEGIVMRTYVMITSSHIRSISRRPHTVVTHDQLPHPSCSILYNILIVATLN